MTDFRTTRSALRRLDELALTPAAAKRLGVKKARVIENALPAVETLLQALDVQGPITRDLWQAGRQWWRLELRGSMDVWIGAGESLGLKRSEWEENLGDIASEAIEHAEELGL